MKGIAAFTLLICGLTLVFSCQFSAREPSYTREQFVSDSIFINHYMLDSLSTDSLYVSLGLKLVKCDAVTSGRLIEHSYKSTAEVMPPVQQKYFLLNANGSVERIMTNDDFMGMLYTTKSYSIIKEAYE